MMMGCRKGDDYQCHFVKGSELAQDRMGKIGDTLKQLGLGTERVVTHEVAITDARRVAQLVNDYAAQLKEIGMSPMKGLG
jgi:quinone-modifying oxidoreductase subunit QmoB